MTKVWQTFLVIHFNTNIKRFWTNITHSSYVDLLPLVTLQTLSVCSMICPTSVEHPLGALTADHNALLQQSLLHVHEETANNGISLEQVSHFKLHHHRRGPLLLTVIFQLIYCSEQQQPTNGCDLCTNTCIFFRKSTNVHVSCFNLKVS